MCRHARAFLKIKTTPVWFELKADSCCVKCTSCSSSVNQRQDYFHLLAARKDRKSDVSSDAFCISKSWWNIWIPAFKMQDIMHKIIRIQEVSACGTNCMKPVYFWVPVYLLPVPLPTCIHCVYRCAHSARTTVWAEQDLYLVSLVSNFAGWLCKASVSSFQKLDAL